jgi:hypothetical protein
MSMIAFAKHWFMTVVDAADRHRERSEAIQRSRPMLFCRRHGSRRGGKKKRHDLWIASLRSR